MAWYDVFSRFYDASLEPHYRAQRAVAAEALEATAGDVVLDLPCGTGQSFAALSRAVGDAGRVVGVDLSAGMLRQATARIERDAFRNTITLRGDASTLSQAMLREAGVVARPNRLHVFLGMSVFSDHVQAFENLWALLAPGGRCVLVDVHNPSPGVQGKLVNYMAQADITRRFWEPLERVGERFERREIESKPLHGGAIFLATARKPG